MTVTVHIGTSRSDSAHVTPPREHQHNTATEVPSSKPHHTRLSRRRHFVPGGREAQRTTQGRSPSGCVQSGWTRNANGQAGICPSAQQRMEAPGLPGLPGLAA
jgi:hypothetical protein